MPTSAKLAAALPPSVKFSQRGAVGFVALARAGKRNALNVETVEGLHHCFLNLPASVKAVVLTGEGEHFSAGLDLSEMTEKDIAGGMAHSRHWHRAFADIEFGKVPVVSVLHGAVVGGGLELACATHVRVAEASTYYALPEGSRGIFVGGGGSVRLPRLIGVARMMDMMLTARTYNAEEGRVLGFSQYVVPNGEGLAKATALATHIADNAPMTNYAVMQVLPRIADGDRDAGYMMESMISSIAQADPEAKARLRAFLDKKAGKVTHKG